MKLIKISEDKFIIIKDNSILYSTYPIDYSEQITLKEVKELIGKSDKKEWDIQIIDNKLVLK